jgi:hypothetical protein
MEHRFEQHSALPDRDWIGPLHTRQRRPARRAFVAFDLASVCHRSLQGSPQNTAALVLPMMGA